MHGCTHGNNGEIHSKRKIQEFCATCILSNALYPRTFYGFSRMQIFCLSLFYICDYQVHKCTNPPTYHLTLTTENMLLSILIILDQFGLFGQFWSLFVLRSLGAIKQLWFSWPYPLFTLKAQNRPWLGFVDKSTLLNQLS